MALHSFMAEMQRIARGAKVHATRKRPADIAPFVLAKRGDDPVALVTIRQHERDLILQVASVCAGGFDADMIGIAFETYMAAGDPRKNPKINLNPMTGQPYGPGEMQQVALNHGGLEKGWLTECVSVMVANRAGDQAMSNMAFRYVGGRHLSWVDQDTDLTEWSTLREGQQTSGIMPEAVIKFMNSKSTSQYVPADFPLDRDQRDLATGALLSAQGHAVLMMAEGDDANRIRRFKEAGTRRM